MQRSSLPFQKQPFGVPGSKGSSPGQESSTVWKRVEEKIKTDQKSILSNGMPHHSEHAKTVTFDVNTDKDESAIVDEEPTEEELLKQGIHLARRLSSDVHHREFNWDEDDDDTTWPISMNKEFLPMLNTSKEDSENIKEVPNTLSPKQPSVPTVASTPWKITQPHNVTPIDKQLKELSEQQHQQQQQPHYHQHQHYNHANDLWHTRRDSDSAMDPRYRFSDPEKRYRSNDPLPRPELFNETNGQIETVARRPGGGRLGFHRASNEHGPPVENNHILDSYDRRHHGYEGDHPIGHRRGNSDAVSQGRGFRRSVPEQPGPPPKPQGKSIVEEQEEVMRLARENARKRKEEEQKREKELLEASKRKAEELVAKLAAKHKESVSSEESFSEPIVQEKSFPSKPVILQPSKPKRGNSFPSEDNPAFGAVSSVIGDDSDQARSTTDNTKSKLWPGNSNSTNLWNASPTGTRSTSEGGLWGPINVSSIYNKSNKFKGEKEAEKEHGRFAPLSPTINHRSMLSSWSTLGPNTSASGGSKETSSFEQFTTKSEDWKSAPPATLITTTRIATSPVNSPATGDPSRDSRTPTAPRPALDSPTVARGTSRFFPSHPGEIKETNLNTFDVYPRTTVTSSSAAIPESHCLTDLVSKNLNVPRIILPPAAESRPETNLHSYKAPSLNSIQALQSTIAEKLGSRVTSASLRSPSRSLAAAALPIPASPIVASDIPPESSTVTPVSSYKSVLVPQAAGTLSQHIPATKELNVKPATEKAPLPVGKEKVNRVKSSAQRPTTFADIAASGLDSAKPIAQSSLPSSHPVKEISGSLEPQTGSFKLEEAISSYALQSVGSKPSIRLLPATTSLSLVMYTADADWDKGLIIPENTFSESSFYYETPTSRAFLREFKPRKDIYAAILIPGGKKITTKFRQEVSIKRSGGQKAGDSPATVRRSRVSSLKK